MHEIRKRVCGADRGQPSDGAPSARNHNLGASLYLLQVLAEAIVKCPNTHLIVPCM